MYENLIKKYGVSEEEIKDAVESLMKSVVSMPNFNLVLALTDLLAAGDIKK